LEIDCDKKTIKKLKNKVLLATIAAFIVVAAILKSNKFSA
jgi:hypothetical protein